MGCFEIASVLGNVFRSKFVCREIPMINEHCFVSDDQPGTYPYTRSQAPEHFLDMAIVQADITESLEEYCRELS